MWETWVWSLGWEIPWRRKWLPTPVLLSGKSHGWRSLVGYSPWGHKESDTTERLHFPGCQGGRSLPHVWGLDRACRKHMCAFFTPIRKRLSTLSMPCTPWGSVTLQVASSRWGLLPIPLGGWLSSPPQHLLLHTLVALQLPLETPGPSGWVPLPLGSLCRPALLCPSVK